MPEKKKIFHFSRLGVCAILLLALITSVQAEEKSLWNKFVDFFSPSTVKGEGPQYDELRELDSQISKLEGKYSRERRPGNKARIKKEIDELRTKRDDLAKQIEEREKSGTSSSSNAATSSDSADTIASSSATVQEQVVIHDTVFVHDTVTVHDTLYVIVANKPEAESSAATAPTTADSSNSTVPDNK